ncbi:MAG: hypothetical protein IPK00_25545 [Deltaproteobacteria bacterium]|nr:hypothetical protein [Deltaproteobacteria bacterium]
MRIILPSIALLVMGCPMSDSSSPEQAAQEQFAAAAETPVGVIGARFAGHLVAKDFERASEMLVPSLRDDSSATELESRYEAMIEYAGGPAESVQPVTTMSDWPGKRPGDQAWVYVAIDGQGFSEGVTLIVTDDGRIREIEWGRP